MRVLKTIVATAVIVFVMTTVAMAGVQHLTRAQDTKQLEKTAPQYTVTLTAGQLARLLDHQSGSHVPAAQRTSTHPRRVQSKHTQARQGAHEPESRHAGHVQKSTQRSTANQSSAHHAEQSSQTHVSTGGHDGGQGDSHGGSHDSGDGGHGGGHGGD
jgi:uncharacterized membrane protein YgcG